MSESGCLEREALIAYLYGECEPRVCAEAEAHVRGCVSCANELESIETLRETLAAWTVPETPLGVRVVAEAAGSRRSTAPHDGRPVWWRHGARRRAASRGWQAGLGPAWSAALVAALVLVVATAAAGIEFRYGESGLFVRVGWFVAADAGMSPRPASPAPSDAPPGEARPWEPDLLALERSLRAEFAAGTPIVAPPRLGRDMLRDEMRTMIRQSERRQQQEFALGMMTLAQEFDLQRQEDNLRLQEDVDWLTDYVVRVSGR